ncbi:MAG: PKD domain-containing protein [Sphingobacteriales bacterium]|nr:MAG: PKD domain-containing protein [Sphingobacteriales bacterium]
MKTFIIAVLIMALPVLPYAQSSKYFDKALSWADNNNAHKIMQNENGGYFLISTDKNNFTELWKPHFVELDSYGNIISVTNVAPDSLQGRLYDALLFEDEVIGVGALFEITTPSWLATPWFMNITYLNSQENEFENTTMTGECGGSKVAIACELSTNNRLLVGGYQRICGYGRMLQFLIIDPISKEVLLDTIYSNLFVPDKLDWIQDMAATSDGGAYLLASINMGGLEGDIALVKIDSLGNWQWHQIYDIGSDFWDSEDYASSIISTQDGGLIFTGRNSLYVSEFYGSTFKLASDFTVQWHYQESFFRGAAVEIFELTDSSIVLAGCGSSTQAPNLVRGEIVKLDKNGNKLWRRTYGGNKNDYFYGAIVQNHDQSGKSGYVLCGRTESNLPPGRADAWLVRLNCMGLLTEPEALFSHTVLAGAPPNVITFINQSQYVYPDSIDGGYYRWNWGDGTPPFICGQGYEPCGGSLPNHTYQTPGIYTVTLTAIVCNDTSTYTQYVCAGNYSPGAQASFIHEDFGGTVFFANTSQNAHFDQTGISVWNFGDGSFPSYETHPHHTYAENGSYTVTLTVVVCADTSVYAHEVVVQTVSLPPDPLKGENSILVYPNPAQNTLTFALTEGSKSPSGDLGVTEGGKVEIKLLSLTGQTVLQTTFAAGETHKTVSVAHLPAGLYVYVVENGGVVVARGKVAVVR